MKKELPKLKERLVDNGMYKVVSLVVALVIWATTISARKDVVLIRGMELDYRTPVNLTLVGDYPQTVKIKVAGPRAALKKFSQMSSRIILNLQDVSEGTHLLTIESAALELPTGVKFLSAEPNRIRVQVAGKGN